MPFPSFIPLDWTPMPWAASAVSVIILVWAASEVLYRLKGGIRSATDGRSSEVIGTAMLFNMAALPLLGATRIGAIAWNPELLSMMGISVALAGTLLRYWAILTLGRYFTSAVLVQQEQELIERGPFRLVRHPGYTGVLLFGAGIGLSFGNPLAAGLYLLTQGAAILYRVKVEERVLSQAFGERFTAYSTRTWKLVPFLY